MATPDATAITDGEVLRAGSRALSLFVSPLNARILRAHVDGPKRLAELQEVLGWPAHTTLRAAVVALREVKALEKRRVKGTPYGVASALTPGGEELLMVGEVLEAWLQSCPDGPIAPDTDAARSAVKALAGGWSSTLIWALADRSSTLTELNRLIPEISYPSLERLLTRMRNTRQIEPVATAGRGTPYVVTDWLRRAVAPVCAAGRYERRHLEHESARATEIEIEAAFMLAIPLVSLPDSAEGTCALAVKTAGGESGDDDPGFAGVTVEICGGQVLSCKPELSSEPSTWAVGISKAWLDLVIDGRSEALRLGGARPQLALDLVGALHRALSIDR